VSALNAPIARLLYPCECGGNEGISHINPTRVNTGVRFTMSEAQALFYNAENWKNGLSLIYINASYELRCMTSSSH
jgi:hypothetical protein